MKFGKEFAKLTCFAKLRKKNLIFLKYQNCTILKKSKKGKRKETEKIKRKEK